MRRRWRRRRAAIPGLPALALALAFTLMPGPARAQKVPGEVLDLGAWKLTLPVDTDRPGRPDEVDPPAVARFADPRFFFVNPAGDGVVLRAPCGGATTKGSSYPRSELREVTAKAKDAAWDTDDGRVHRLTARLAVTELPARKPHVVCAQIHDAESDLIEIRVERTKLIVQRDGAGDVVLDPKYALGTPFDLVIEARAGRVAVSYNGERKLDWEAPRKKCYFKAGCYTQSNPERGDAPDAAGAVTIHALKVEHDGA
jgi:poly(beta-D-mannuronate) lyase